MPGDVIIYQKNGGSDTPVIHRALLEVGEYIRRMGCSWYHTSQCFRHQRTFDILCPYHGGAYDLRIEDWDPVHAGYLTKGDNFDCMIDWQKPIL